MTKEEFESNKDVLDENYINKVREQYNETAKEAENAKKEYKEYINAKNWDFALYSYIKYQKYSILAESFAAYIVALSDSSSFASLSLIANREELKIKEE